MGSFSDRIGSGLGKLALVLTSLLIAALVAEGGLRIARDAPTASPASAPRPAHLDGLPELRGLFALTGRNVRGVASGVLFETNSHRFRGPERTLAKPAGVYRVALIGDSIAMGHGVVYESTYGHLLEQRLNARGDRIYEVLNLALSGLNTRTIVDRYESLGAPFDPDLILYGYTLNDIQDAHYIRSYDDQYGDFAHFSRSPSHLVRFLGPRWRAFSEAVFAPRGSLAREIQQNYFENEAAWADVLVGFDRISKHARESGICAVLFVHTSLYSLNFLHPFLDVYDQIGDAAAERDLIPIQSFEHLRGRDPTDLWLALGDAHPNDTGHRILESALWEGLQRLPADCSL